jgi:predicted anti-sigma-YlaC factor YlaD
MTCDDFRPLITGYLDGELADEDRRRLEDHLGTCDTCARELEAMKRLKEDLAMMRFKEPSDVELERYWQGVYNRLERGLGWILFSAGAIILLCYGAFRLIEGLIADPTVSLALKVGVVALTFGVIVLFVSLLRERLAVRKVDRYSKEIDR